MNRPTAAALVVASAVGATAVALVASRDRAEAPAGGPRVELLDARVRAGSVRGWRRPEGSGRAMAWRVPGAVQPAMPN